MPSLPTILVLSLSLLASSALAADPPRLPAPDEIFTISIKPHARQLTAFFTPESLEAALPHFKRAHVTPPIGGKIWSQSGVIVTKDKRVLYWRSYRDDLLALETAVEPVCYVIE